MKLSGVVLFAFFAFASAKLSEESRWWDKNVIEALMKAFYMNTLTKEPISVLNAKWMQIFEALNHMVPEAEKIPKPEHCFFGVDTNVGSQVYNDKIAVCKTALKSLMDKIQAKKTFSDANYVENFILNEFMTGLTDYTNAEKTYDHLKAFLTEYIKDTSSPNSIDTKDPERVRCLVDQVEELHKAGNPQSITHMANELRKLLRRIDYETDKPAEKKHTETTTSTARTTSTGSAETIKTSTGTTGTAESAKTTETTKTETSNTGAVHLPRIY